MKSQDEIIELLKFKMDEEGFDYCFTDYSEWEDIEDEKFHKLRKNYVKSKKALEDYVNGLSNGEDDIDNEDTLELEEDEE